MASANANVGYAIGDRVYDIRNINALELTDRAALASGIVTTVNNASVDIKKRSGESVTIPLEYTMSAHFFAAPV
jgi:hypothetical protein